MISDEEKDVGSKCELADRNSVGNKGKNKKGFLVIRFSFLAEIASVDLLAMTEKKKKCKIKISIPPQGRRSGCLFFFF